MILPTAPILFLAASLFGDQGFFSQVLLIGGLTLITFYLISRIKRRRKDGGARLTGHEQLERNRQQRGLRGDLEQLMVEVEQLAKRMGSQLDAKSHRLEMLVRQADERIAELRRLQGDVPAHDAAAPAPPPSPDRLDAASIATPMPDAAAQPEASLPQGALARSVYALADQGLTSAQIAKELDEQVGKVELVLALRRV
jgi:hypothetical protein